MSALAELQTIVAVHARGSSSSRFGPPLVLRPDGGVEIIEPSGPPLVVPAANVASYRPAMRGAGTPEIIPYAKDLASELSAAASPAKPPPSAGGVVSPPVDPRRGRR